MSDIPARHLITGASSGIGQAVAIMLAAPGRRIAVTGRREEMLRDTARAVEARGAEALLLVGDVTSSADLRRHHEAIGERFGGVDWALLNAGISLMTRGTNFDAGAYRKTFRVNVRGVLLWLEALLPDMIARNRGTIGVVSSLASFRALPGSGAYCASKAALNALCEGLRADLRGRGVRLVTITPGFVKSEITARNDPREMMALMEREPAAAAVIAAMARGKRLAHFPKPFSWVVKNALTLLPRALWEPLATRVIRRAKKPYLDASETSALPESSSRRSGGDL